MMASPNLLYPGETLDQLDPPGISIIQSGSGYRFSLDPILLCAFAGLDRERMIADLGTGSGIIPLLLAHRLPASRIFGVEVQPALADRARRSVLLNGLNDRVEIVEEDLRSLRGLPAGVFEAVLANPPFRPLGTGRLAPQAERAAARHETVGGIKDFIAAATFLLKTAGRFFVIHLAERLAELISEMQQQGLTPKRLRSVHSRRGEGARLVLVEGRRNGGNGVTVEEPWYLYQDDGTWSKETMAAYGISSTAD